MSLPIFVLPVTYVHGRDELTQVFLGFSCMCVTHWQVLRDQYFGRSQVARIVSIRSNGLKAITTMQYSSHGDLSHSGYHLESLMTLSRSAF